MAFPSAHYCGTEKRQHSDINESQEFTGISTDVLIDVLEAIS